MCVCNQYFCDIVHCSVLCFTQVKLMLPLFLSLSFSLPGLSLPTLGQDVDATPLHVPHLISSDAQ